MNCWKTAIKLHCNPCSLTQHLFRPTQNLLNLLRLYLALSEKYRICYGQVNLYKVFGKSLILFKSMIPIITYIWTPFTTLSWTYIKNGMCLKETCPLIFQAVQDAGKSGDADEVEVKSLNPAVISWFGAIHCIAK